MGQSLFLCYSALLPVNSSSGSCPSRAVISSRAVTAPENFCWALASRPALLGIQAGGKGLFHQPGDLLHGGGGSLGQRHDLLIALGGCQSGHRFKLPLHHPHHFHRPLGKALCLRGEMAVLFQGAIHLVQQHLLVKEIAGDRDGGLRFRVSTGILGGFSRWGCFLRRSGGGGGSRFRCRFLSPAAGQQGQTAEQQEPGPAALEQMVHHRDSSGSFPKTLITESSSTQLSPSQRCSSGLSI